MRKERLLCTRRTAVLKMVVVWVTNINPSTVQARKYGEMLKEMPKAKGVKMEGIRRLHDVTTEKLSDYGIEKHESHSSLKGVHQDLKVMPHYIQVFPNL